MADESAALISYLRSRKVSQKFTPCAYYGPEEDALIFYFRNDPDYAKRVNKWLTLYLAMDSDELVGCQVKGVRKVLEDMGSFGIDFDDKKVKLKIIFQSFLGAVPDEAREHFRRIGRAAAETDPRVEIEEAVT